MNFLTPYIALATDWIKSRWAERTTWDGVVIIAICGGYLLLDGLITWIAYAGVAYGIYTLVAEQE